MSLPLPPGNAVATRIEARLAALPRAELEQLVARACDDARASWEDDYNHGGVISGSAHVRTAVMRQDVERRLAIHAPTPGWITDMLISPDLAPQFLAALNPERDSRVSRVCRAWARAWAAKTRRVPRLVKGVLPENAHQYLLASLPDGRLASTMGPGYYEDGRDHIFIDEGVWDDDEGEAAPSSFISVPYPTFHFLAVTAMVASNDGLYVTGLSWQSGIATSRLCRYDLSDFSPVVSVTPNELQQYLVVAAAAGLLAGTATGWESRDLITLEVRMSVEVRDENARALRSGETGETHPASGLAVLGEEVFIGSGRDNKVRVYSLTGQHLRTLPLWNRTRKPLQLLGIGDRLYLSEKRPNDADVRSKETWAIDDWDPAYPGDLIGRTAAERDGRLFVSTLDGVLLHTLWCRLGGEIHSMCLRAQDHMLLISHNTNRKDSFPYLKASGYREDNKLHAVKGL